MDLILLAGQVVEQIRIDDAGDLPQPKSFATTTLNSVNSSTPSSGYFSTRTHGGR